MQGGQLRGAYGPVGPVPACAVLRRPRRTPTGSSGQPLSPLRCIASSVEVQQLDGLALAPAVQPAAQWNPPGDRPTASTIPPTASSLLPVAGAPQQPVQCIRPDVHAGGRVTPAKLEALSQVLRLPVRQLQALLVRAPQLVNVPPARVASVLDTLRQDLGLSQYEARLMLTQHTEMVLSLTSAQLRDRAQALAAALGVAPKQVLTAAGSVPSILKRSTADVTQRLQRMAAALGGISTADMLQLAARAPQFLTATPGEVAGQLEEASAILRRPPHLIVRALHTQPDLLFMSSRILRNKVRVVQRILNRPLRLVAPVLLACPSLLRTDMDAVRAAFAVLVPISGKDEGFAFGMVCHSPHLLLIHPHLLLGEARHLRHVTSAVPAWLEQMKRFNPSQLADCLSLSAPTHARLAYLVRTQQAEGIPLHTAVTLSRQAFLARYPDAGPSLNVSRVQPQALPPIPVWTGGPAAKPQRVAKPAVRRSAPLSAPRAGNADWQPSSPNELRGSGAMDHTGSAGSILDGREPNHLENSCGADVASTYDQVQGDPQPVHVMNGTRGRRYAADAQASALVSMNGTQLQGEVHASSGGSEGGNGHVSLQHTHGDVAHAGSQPNVTHVVELHGPGRPHDTGLHSNGHAGSGWGDSNGQRALHVQHQEVSWLELPPANELAHGAGFNGVAGGVAVGENTWDEGGAGELQLLGLSGHEVQDGQSNGVPSKQRVLSGR